MPLHHRCDGHIDCADGKDEANCAKTDRVYQVTDLYVPPVPVPSDQVIVSWTRPDTDPDIHFEYMPSIAQVRLTFLRIPE